MDTVPEARGREAGGDSGLACLILLARYHGVPADAAQLRRGLAQPERPIGETDLVRAARRLGLRARGVRSRWSRLGATPVPALVILAGGACRVLARVEAATVLLHDAEGAGAIVLSRAEFEARWTGRLILVTRRRAGSDGAPRFGLGWFVPAILRYRWVLTEVLVASLFVQVFGLLAPLFTQVVVDRVLVHKALTTLHVLVAGMLAAAVFEVILTGLRTYLLAHTSSRIDVELGAALFRHVLALPLAYFEARRAGDTVARVRELDRVRELLTGSTVTLLIDSLFTGVFVAVMTIYSPGLTVLVGASMLGLALLSAAITPMLRRRLHEKFDRGAESQAFLVESITGIETVKALAVEPSLQRRWEEQLAAYVRASFRVVSLASLGGQTASLLQKATTIAILWLGAQAVMRGELTVGEMIAFNMLAARVTAPVLRIVQVWQDFQQVGVSVARLGDLLNAPREPAALPAQGLPPRLAGSVTFEDVTFRYRAERAEVLRGVSFSVTPGQVIGIVGRSGSGKSTVGRLIQRLYVPERGRVLVDGLDVSQVDPAWLRRQVAMVPQESFLLNRTVRENIALADPGIPFERVLRAAALAGVDEFVRGLPQGYDTPVGEHGCALSGGQRQRIAIARALVTSPRILILDEATSALDSESEQVIQRNLGQICAGRTVFLIAHRLATLRPAHRILVLDRGGVVEDGTHADLMARGGLYAWLSRHQSGAAPLRPGESAR